MKRFALLMFVSSALCHGQTEITTAAAPPKESSLASQITDFLGAGLRDPTIREKIFAGTGVLIAGWLAILVPKKKALARRLAGPRFGLPANSKEYSNRVLLVGLGGAGKTSLIQKLTADPRADPRVRSARFETYSLVHEVVSEEEARVYRIDIDDYRGQNQGDLVAAWTQMNRDAEAVAIRSLILVVDLFPPAAHGEIAQPQETISAERVKQTIEQWSDAAISAIMGLASDELNYLCLFINKADLLLPRTAESQRLILRAYQPLVECLAKRSGGILFETKIGSTASDESIVTLMHSLIERAVPIGKDQR
jgi:tRNA A37 threonylcarbamoyladenosine biosynthesis protein TsaE